MSEKSKPTGKIEFIENHRPALPSGEYGITVSQSIKATKQSIVLVDNEAEPFKSTTRYFSVQGPRFALEPQVIRAVFPPDGSLGEHSSVLPHISFNRSTLPWERFVMPLDDAEREAMKKQAKERSEDQKKLADTIKLKTPWLALLLFDQDELVEKTGAEGDKAGIVEAQLSAGKVSGPRACKLLRNGEFWTLVPNSQTADPEGTLAPVFPYEIGQQDGDPVSVIDVAVDLLNTVLPSLEDVQLLGHVRQPTDDLRTPVGDQVATLLGNRLPQAGHMSVIHLVSLEGLYGLKKSSIWNLPEDAASVRLVSLKSWQFTCLAEKHSFKGLLKGLDRSPGTLQLPPDGLKNAAPLAKQGYVPMPHEMRQGNRSVSWYRGPLAPGFVEPRKSSLPARSADQLVRYNPGNAMFDVSYAAAWELGRLLTLQNEKVAVSLLDWKRRHRHAQEMKQAMSELEHLPIIGRSDLPDLPADVTQWFKDLALLKGVPFNYLVPDERMLPPESIRFFWIDPDWIRCLHDGAFSIGRVLPSDHERDADNHNLLPKSHAIVTGFLLRSEVVSGWPDLQVDGYDEAVAHENYEHETLTQSIPPLDSKLQKDLQEAMNKGDARNLASQFNLGEVKSIIVNPIVADSRWLVNVNENETLYLVEKTKDGFQLSIENKLPLLKPIERLSPNVLICMFAGDIKTVDIHQKPEALHFGLSRSGENESIRYYKELKSHRGGELPGCEVEVRWKADNDKRVIAIKDLSGDMQTKLKDYPNEALEDVAANSVGELGVTDFKAEFIKAVDSQTSAQFALQMTEGVQKVRFVVRQ